MNKVCVFNHGQSEQRQRSFAVEQLHFIQTKQMLDGVEHREKLQ